MFCIEQIKVSKCGNNVYNFYAKRNLYLRYNYIQDYVKLLLYMLRILLFKKIFHTLGVMAVNH